MPRSSYESEDMLIELLLVAVVLMTLFLSRQFRVWFLGIGRAEKQVGLAIILLSLVFQFWDVSRISFPLVRWGMYSEKYTPDEMQWGKLKARLQDGSFVDVNPTTQFPSLNRNFAERFQAIVAASQKGQLTELGERVYFDLLTAVGEQYNRNHSDNPAIELSAMLERISIVDGHCQVQLECVSTVSLGAKGERRP